MSHGIHTKPNNGASNDWLTPPEIISALGEFDLDPCAHPAQLYRTAARMIAPPQDGLACQWRGCVWLNPPYGQKLRVWLARLASHGDGIALVPSRTEVEQWFWPYVWEAATALFFFKGRLYFRRPDGSKQGNAGHGSVLAAYGSAAAARIQQSGLSGRLIQLRT